MLIAQVPRRFYWAFVDRKDVHDLYPFSVLPLLGWAETSWLMACRVRHSTFSRNVLDTLVNSWLREAFATWSASSLALLCLIIISFSFLPNAFPLGKIFLRCQQNISTTIDDQHPLAHGIFPFEMEIALSIISTCFLQKQY